MNQETKMYHVSVLINGEVYPPLASLIEATSKGEAEAKAKVWLLTTDLKPEVEDGDVETYAVAWKGVLQPIENAAFQRAIDNLTDTARRVLEGPTPKGARTALKCARSAIDAALRGDTDRKHWERVDATIKALESAKLTRREAHMLLGQFEKIFSE